MADALLRTRPEVYQCTGCGHPWPDGSLWSRCPACDESAGCQRRWPTTDEVKAYRRSALPQPDESKGKDSQ